MKKARKSIQELAKLAEKVFDSVKIINDRKLECLLWDHESWDQPKKLYDFQMSHPNDICGTSWDDEGEITISIW